MSTKILNGLDLQSQKVINLASPSASTDAANKAYVDNTAAGLAIKPSVIAATTANITLSGLQTIDGIAVTAAQRVLVKNQSTASQNGIYLANSSAWTLATDSTTGELVSGSLVTVESGTVNAFKSFILATADPITVGTTSQTWSPFAVGQTYTNGNGLTLSSNTFAVNADGTSIIADGTSVRIATTYSGLAKRYAVNVPSGSTTATITHSLGTTDVIIQVYEISTGNQVEPDVQSTSTSTATLTFAVAPTSGQYRCVVLG